MKVGFGQVRVARVVLRLEPHGHDRIDVARPDARALRDLQGLPELHELLLDGVVGHAFASALLDVAVHVGCVEAGELAVMSEDSGKTTEVCLVDRERREAKCAALHVTAGTLSKENQGVVHGRLALGCVSRMSGVTFVLPEDGLGGTAVGAARGPVDATPFPRVEPTPPTWAVLAPVDSSVLLHPSCSLMYLVRSRR